ncbi:MAG: aminotransferase class I/II-fold pyridoxal phosphate-dependent enzyme [Bacteroidota bacterium]
MEKILRQAYDPEQFRKDGYALVDLLADHLARTSAKQEVASNGQMEQALPWIAPEESLAFWQKDKQTADASPATFFEQVLAQSVQLHNPHYMGHQISPPVPVSALAGFLGDFINNGMGVYEMGMASSTLERVVVTELAKAIGFGEQADGVLTSGGTLGNLTALLTARRLKAKSDVWNEGGNQQLALMVSEQAHYCVDRAVRIMGWGAEGIIKVPCNDRFEMRTDLLEHYYQEATASGKQVIAVVGSACSTSTGSFDDLSAIAAFCKEHALWFHVDGAHGGATVYSEKYRHLVKGIELADSVVVDFHKMLMTPSITTALVYCKGLDSYQTFSQEAQYLWAKNESPEWYNLAKRTFECTKLLLSVRVYSIMRTHGTALFDAFVSTCYDLGKTLAGLVIARANFSLLTPPACNIVCFRYEKEGVDLNALNERIREQLKVEGTYYIVQTKIKGETWLRTTLTNPFTEVRHLEGLLDRIEEVVLEIDTADCKSAGPH